MNRSRIAKSIPKSLAYTLTAAVIVFALTGLAHGLAVGAACAAASNAVIAIVLMVVRRRSPDASTQETVLFGAGLWLTSSTPFVGIFVGARTGSAVLGSIAALVALALGAAALKLPRR